MFQARIVGRIEIVDSENLVPRSQQLPAHIRSNESRAASHQIAAHHNIPSTRTYKSDPVVPNAARWAEVGRRNGFQDPIQLVWMVSKLASYRVTECRG